MAYGSAARAGIIGGAVPAALLRLRWFALAFAGVVSWVLARDLAVTPYDDAYFFARFAHNFLRHGVFAWNVADGPVQGITSQLFQLVATVLVWGFPGHFVIACKALLALCLCGTVWLLARTSAQLAQSNAAGGVIALLALGTPPVLATMCSCMETALALLLVTWSLTWVSSPEQRPASVALRTVLVYACRPDAALIPALAYGVTQLRDRARLLRFVAVLAVVLGACLAVLRAYYGTALPLPFYLKSFMWTPYGDELARQALHSKLEHLVTFAALAWPLFVLALRGARSGSPALALLLAAALFVAYHALTNNEIMGYRARFYLPALIPLALAAASAWPELRARWSLRVLAPVALAWVGLIAIGHRVGLVDPEKEASPSRPLPTSFAELSDDAFVARSIGEVRSLRGLAEVARCLPDVAQVYHSEIGALGLVLPDARIVDLAGLMSKHIAFDHPAFDSYCLSDRPEVLFLPHRNYAALNHEIARGACIGQYTRVVERSSSPLYIRSDLAERFLRCARRPNAAR